MISISDVSAWLNDTMQMTLSITRRLTPVGNRTHRRDLGGRCIHGGTNVRLRKGIWIALKSAETVEEIKAVLARHITEDGHSFLPSQFLIFGQDGRTLNGHTRVSKYVLDPA